uniref:Uncharacterized protein n=1 Tax=Anguilla anguilla TaxID=7936 RepID=A0A0E9UED1_ANGAN
MVHLLLKTLRVMRSL